MEFTNSSKTNSFSIKELKVSFEKFSLAAIVIVFAFIFSSASVIAQTKSFEFLNVPGNASLSSLGGVNVSSANQNVNFFQSNPALAGDTTNGWGSASYLFYFGNVGMANFSYQHDFKKTGLLSFGVQHIGYGQIDGYDVVGASTGKFNSGETAIFIGKSHRINNFRLGVNMKGVFSNMAGYRANAILFDIGGVFVHPQQDLKVGITIKNFGFLLSEYSETSTTSLPFDVQAGVTFKPEHMPIRFSFTAHHLTTANILYNNESEEANTLDKVMAHFSLGAELLVHKNVNLLVGYNFLKHQELKLDYTGGGSGFSAGILARVKSMELAVSRTGYVTGGCYQVTLSANIEKIVTRK